MDGTDQATFAPGECVEKDAVVGAIKARRREYCVGEIVLIEQVEQLWNASVTRRRRVPFGDQRRIGTNNMGVRIIREALIPYVIASSKQRLTDTDSVSHCSSWLA
jgi:hypothetical protein